MLQWKTKIWFKLVQVKFRREEITKLTFRAFAPRRHFPIRLRSWFRAFAFHRHFPIRIRSWRFERSPFVVNNPLHYEVDVSRVRHSSFIFRLDYEADVSSVRFSLSLSDKITRLVILAFALRRHLTISLRSWRLERSPFVSFEMVSRW